MIRILPTITSLISSGREPSDLLAFSVAAMFRFLTPKKIEQNGLFLGYFPQSIIFSPINTKETFTYGNNLRVSIDTKEYQFRNDNHTDIPVRLKKIAEERCTGDKDSISSLLNDLVGLECSDLWRSWTQSVSKWYNTILEDESNGQGHYETLKKVVEQSRWLRVDEIEQIVSTVVKETPVIDLHTHLFPQSHGKLMLYGIDELLTYHYLVAEYFMVAPMDMVPESKIGI